MSVQQGNNCIMCNDKVGLFRNVLTPFDQSTDRIFVAQWYLKLLSYGATSDRQKSVLGFPAA